MRAGRRCRWMMPSPRQHKPVPVCVFAITNCPSNQKPFRRCSPTARWHLPGHWHPSGRAHRGIHHYQSPLALPFPSSSATGTNLAILSYHTVWYGATEKPLLQQYWQTHKLAPHPTLHGAYAALKLKQCYDAASGRYLHRRLKSLVCPIRPVHEWVSVSLQLKHGIVAGLLLRCRGEILVPLQHGVEKPWLHGEVLACVLLARRARISAPVARRHVEVHASKDSLDWISGLPAHRAAGGRVR
jgi:hypothetical protein